jgi:hypothetical protein
MLDAHQNPVSENIGQQAAAPRATSSRNPGRHHLGILGGIIPVCPGGFVGIRTQRKEAPIRSEGE